MNGQLQVKPNTESASFYCLVYEWTFQKTSLRLNIRDCSIILTLNADFWITTACKWEGIDGINRISLLSQSKTLDGRMKFRLAQIRHTCKWRVPRRFLLWIGVKWICANLRIWTKWDLRAASKRWFEKFEVWRYLALGKHSQTSVYGVIHIAFDWGNHQQGWVVLTISVRRFAIPEQAFSICVKRFCCKQLEWIGLKIYSTVNFRVESINS